VIKQINILLELTKFRISLFSTLSAGAGFMLAKQGMTAGILVPVFGVFFLACGSCALNQYQERRFDKLMDRTRHRPLPSGKLSPGICLLISMSSIFTGATILAYWADLIALGLGIFAVLWYNGIYTFLKQRTAFATIPGALIGAIPPAIGWASGGGSLTDPRIWVVGCFFFIWQVPHFWLLLLNFGKDYENGGFPSLTRRFTLAQIRRMTFVWVFATAVISVIIPLFGVVKSQPIIGCLFAAGLWLVLKTSEILRSNKRGSPFPINFKIINLYVLMVMFLFSLDKLFY
jgi:protoheme IX farnesyltransferase